jgi:hypothetical protein
MFDLEKENTWRALQGVKPIQSWRCRLGWHRWTNYEIRERNEFGGVWARCSCADCGMPRIEPAYTKAKNGK